MIAVDTALFTDFYSLTMAQGYWKYNPNRKAVFEMFYRRQPFGGGYAIFTGLETLLNSLAALSFSDDDIEYLKGLGYFEDGFLSYLKDFRFTGSIWAVNEGTVVFPHEPLIRIESSLIECQLIEGLILNIINFQTLIATKARRVWLATRKGSLMEFGLRRAQGPDGALSATRASYIGGANGTSNTLAGKILGIPVLGTMAHSWVMSFASEEEAFKTYGELYADNAVFLIDTYDTLKSGIISAINAGKKLKEQGKSFGVRLDSGDIQYLAVEVRKMLDEAGLNKAFITVSSDLDESIIENLVNANAPVNTWGVGTRMVTGGTESAFSGVYKMTACADENGQMAPVMKFSDNPEKTTNPGIKQVWRIKDSKGAVLADVLALDDDDIAAMKVGDRGRFWHPAADYRHFFYIIETPPQPLLKKYMADGKICGIQPTLDAIRAYSAADLDAFDVTYKRLLNPHGYKVSITEKLRNLKLELLQRYIGDL